MVPVSTRKESSRIPPYCGFDCPHAAFPPADTAGICRTMAAVWCRKLRRLVNKNRPCEWRQHRRRACPPRTSNRS
jgi:hypothetical protein